MLSCSVVCFVWGWGPPLKPAFRGGAAEKRKTLGAILSGGPLCAKVGGAKQPGDMSENIIAPTSRFTTESFGSEAAGGSLRMAVKAVRTTLKQNTLVGICKGLESLNHSTVSLVRISSNRMR